MYDDEEARTKARKRRDLKELAREHPVRLSILAALSKEGDGLTAEQMRDLPGGRAPQAVAYHLRVLREAGLVHVGSGPAPRYALTV